MAMIDISSIVDVRDGGHPTIETYKELELAYVFFNERLFQNQLPPCLITLQREKRTLGYHSHGRFVNADGEKIDELALNPSYFGVRSIKQTLSTLVHEQAHALMDVLGIQSRRGYHCKKWGNIMKNIGLYPSNTGKFGGKETGQQMSHYIIQGGLFDVACDELLSHEFKLSWFDRYPPCSPIDLDVPLPSSFLVTTVAIQPKKPPKPVCLEDDEDDEFDRTITLDLTGDLSRVNKVLGFDDDYMDDEDDSDAITTTYVAPVAELGTSKPDVLVSDIVKSEKGKVIDEDEDQIIIEVEDDGLSGISIDLLNKPTTENHSNRLKYRCSICNVQVWGKPKLKLKCGEENCKDNFLTVVE